ADRNETELPDDARDVLTVKAAAGHHGNLVITAAVSGGDHAAMPKRPYADRAAATLVAAAVRFCHEGIAQRGTDQPDQPCGSPGDQRELDSLPKRKFPFEIRNVAAAELSGKLRRRLHEC